MTNAKTILTTKETRVLCVELTRLFQNGNQNVLTWKTRDQLLNIVNDFIAYETKPDLFGITKEGLVFILNIIPDTTRYFEFKSDALFKSIRKRAYKVIETRTQNYYNM